MKVCCQGRVLHYTLFLAFVISIISCSYSKKRINKNVKYPKKDYTEYISEANSYILRNHLNNEFFILVDLGVHSGLKRFYVYNKKKEAFVDSFMVSHGCGSSRWSSDNTKSSASFSNEPNSHLSSLGKYIIGERGISNWGINIKYRLYGQEKTNRNASKRAIVLHSWSAVPEDEVYPSGTSEGWGCPAVSNNDMKTIDKLLKDKERLLFWIIS